ncbi:prenyltransferase [compost metagenome]
MILFVMARALQNNLLTLLFLLLLVPIAVLVFRLSQADTRRDFRAISSLCKIIMLLGLVTMIWA